MLDTIREWWIARRVRRNISGKCPECGAIIRWDKHGRDVPPNPLEGREHWPGPYYRCPDTEPFERHGRDGCDLRPYNLEPVSEEEIEEEVERELSE